VPLVPAFMVPEVPYIQSRPSLPEAPCKARLRPRRRQPILSGMQISDWPANERPREKMTARGAGVLSDAELLAIFLGSGTRGRDAVSTARALLAAHGPLRRLLERTPTELAALPCLGHALALQVHPALELVDHLHTNGLGPG